MEVLPVSTARRRAVAPVTASNRPYESLRGAIGYVGQENFLFDGTVRENIRYGKFDADDAAVVEAAKRAEAHEFIANLSAGYDTDIGERGVKLSGGQRQRVAIARTILQDPAILIFDEATSAVDTETELLIQRSVDDLAADRTTFAIAHRLSTVRDADTVLVLDDGRITERGTHDDLIAEDGLYVNLWRFRPGRSATSPRSSSSRRANASPSRPRTLRGRTEISPPRLQLSWWASLDISRYLAILVIIFPITSSLGA